MDLRPDERDLRAPVLVTGATGYIGGRLVPRLLAAGYTVRCVARCAAKLRGRAWAGHPRVQVVEADLADGPGVAAALAGCGAAYYLVHSMMVGPEYRVRDRELAEQFARAAAAAGLRRIVYLGGLGETGDQLSEHLVSRREVETALASGPVPVTVLRAAMIIGSGSASFETLRYLTERLPIMVTPRWVRTECQPIAVRDVLRYLVQCLEQPGTSGRTLDIGGPDVLPYHELLTRMAAALGLRRRWIIPVPVLTPRLSSLWIHLVTPIPRRIAQPLTEGLRNRVVCRDDEAARWMPGPRLSVDEAIATALGQVRAGGVESSWSDAGPVPGDPDWAGGTVFEDRRSTEVHASPAATYAAVCRIGGRNGYFGATWLWRLRGVLDRLAGGPGLRRGRRDPHALVYGDAVDFWRVTGLEPGRRVELRAEMHLPGEAVLDFEVVPLAESRCRLVQRARFKPHGLAGLVYWWMVAPLHSYVFGALLAGLRQLAVKLAQSNGPETEAAPAESDRRRAV